MLCENQLLIHKVIYNDFGGVREKREAAREPRNNQERACISWSNFNFVLRFKLKQGRKLWWL